MPSKKPAAPAKAANPFAAGKPGALPAPKAPGKKVAAKKAGKGAKRA